VTKRRRANRLVVLALTAMFCVCAASACAGDVITAAQMACCMQDHHECEMAMDGESCCTGASQASQQFVRAPKTKFDVDVVTVVAACPPAASLAHQVTPLRERGGQAVGGQHPGVLVACYILNSALLI